MGDRVRTLAGKDTVRCMTAIALGSTQRGGRRMGKSPAKSAKKMQKRGTKQTTLVCLQRAGGNPKTGRQPMPLLQPRWECEHPETPKASCSTYVRACLKKPTKQAKK